ncbi:hypothetical protein PM082_014154 [Marasmius tenuissimus]|nr:hypothetical protein PM082_014154 [Marasmius tenuissimus]
MASVVTMINKATSRKGFKGNQGLTAEKEQVGSDNETLLNALENVQTIHPLIGVTVLAFKAVSGATRRGQLLLVVIPDDSTSVLVVPVVLGSIGGISTLALRAFDLRCCLRKRRSRVLSGCRSFHDTFSSTEGLSARIKRHTYSTTVLPATR